jgi:hypothetical protein
MTSVAKRSICSRQTDLGTPTHQNAVEPRIAFLQALEILDDLLGRPAQHAAGLDCSLGCAAAPPSAPAADRA